MRLLIAALLMSVTGALWAAEFSPDTAVNDAGKATPGNPDELYAFYIPANTPPASVLPDVTKSLQQAAAEKKVLAVIGPDFQLNANILKTAFTQAPQGTLKDATVVYVGNAEGAEIAKAGADAVGAKLVSTPYSGQ